MAQENTLTQLAETREVIYIKKRLYLRIIWNIASHAHICDKKAFPRPCRQVKI